MYNFDVVIIGCGIAGMTAAIYLKRANVNVCIVERTAPGGQINMIHEINNYPGFKSIDGPSFAFSVFDQIRSLDIPYKYGMATEIKNYDDKKIVIVNKEEIVCKAVIIANGRRPRELGLSNEKKLLGNGVSYCSICDGTLYKNKIVCVVGGGNSAIESALYLSDIAKKVYLIHRRNEFRAEAYSMDLVKNKENIEIITNVNIKELIEQNDKLSAIKLDNENTILCDGLFINVGNVPMGIKCENLDTNNGYVVVNNKMKTNIDKIYACGDIIDKDVYQISTAVGEATTAAMNLLKEL